MDGAEDSRLGKRSGSAARFALYPLFAVAAISLPLIIAETAPPFFHGSRFTYFGFFGAAALAAIAAIELRRCRGAPLVRLLPLLSFLGVGFYYLIHVSEYSVKSYDYRIYEGAAIAVLQRTDLYGAGYLYPPLTAQALALSYRLSEGVAAFLGVERDWTWGWDVVFYLYQCSQYFITLLCFYLCFRFARRAGLKAIAGTSLVTIIFILNSPLLRTLKYNQVNLWVLALIMCAILLARSWPAVSGFAIGLAAHIKLYPLVLLAPWGALKKRLVVASAVIGFFAIVFVQTGWGKDWRWWSQFLAFAPGFPAHTHFRNNSVYCLVYNSFTAAGEALGVDTGAVGVAARVAVFVITAAIITWFVVRFVKREKILSRLEPGGAAGGPSRETVRFFSHTVDALSLTLLISPTVWEHHYVFTLPIIIWAYAARGNDHPWLVSLGSFLILALPTFDVFLLSHHRLVGLLILVFCTTPVPLRYEPGGAVSDLGWAGGKAVPLRPTS